VEKVMKRIPLLGTILGLMVMLAASCGGSSGSSSGNPGGHAKSNAGTTQESTRSASYSPGIKPSEFTTKIDNKYFPLKPGTAFVYEGKFHGAPERDVMAVTHDTKRIMGVKCLVASDRVTEGGKLIEQTYDWYAQDKEGNVWYFGEHVTEYENGDVTGHEGSWESGVHGAKPGIAMRADPKVDQTYRQEYSKGVAEDKARIISLNGSAKVPYGTFDHVLVTEEFTPLEPGVVERQYYVAGVGDIVEATVKGPPERIELVDVKHE
jgi:hypothetical protein